MPKPRTFNDLWLAARFVAAGLINTAVGMSVILGLDLGLHLPPAVANGLGYAIGICVAWIMHRGFVFRAEDTGWAVKGRYLAAVATAFALNQIALAVVGHALGFSTPATRALAQFFGVVTYTVTQFALMKTWVFRAKAATQS